MKLSQFLSVLVTKNVTIDLLDLETGSTIASLKAESYAALDDAIEAREVKQWSILSNNHITATLGDAIV